jgi:hypothetical protein
MWIFLNDSFLSIVAHKEQAGRFLVRARFPGDIERAIPGARVVEGAGTDYRFRAVCKCAEVGHALTKAIWDIDYTNFKASVTARGRHDCYMAVWDVMKDAQDDLERAEIKAGKGRKMASPQIG